MLEYTFLWSSTNFLGKQIETKDGAHVADSFSPPKTFSYRRGRFENASDVAGMVNDWNRRFSNFMITHSIPRDPNATHGPRLTHLFKRRPQSIAFLDLENIPYKDGLSRHDLIRDPENTVREQLDHIIPGILDVGWSFVLSSKAGLVDDFRGHLYFDLDASYEPEAITQWIKDQESPYTDLSVYQDGWAIIVENPRLIGMDDPFEKRAFSNRGGCLAPDVPDYSGYVRGTVMQKRTSNELPQLSDIVLSGQHRTDAVVKDYLPRLRHAIGHVDWTDARPHLEAELERLGAGPDVYARLRGDVGRYKGQPLGLAGDRWDKLRAGDHTDALMQPRYVEPTGSVDTEQQRLKKAVVSAIRTGGTHLFRASLGMGKTEAAVVAAVNEGMRGRPAIMVTPSHERGSELCDRLNGELDKQIEEYTDREGQFALPGESMRGWVSWRGRAQPGMCERVAAVEAAQKAGVSVHDSLCGFSQEKKCPHFSTCPYAEQVEGFFAHNWVVPHAMLEQSSRISSDAATIMIDESFVGNLGGHVQIDLAELEGRDSTLSDIYDMLAKRAKQPEVNEITPIDKDRLEEALAIELESRTVPEIDTDWEDDDIVGICEEATEMYRSRVVSLLRGLIEEHDGGRNHVYCYKAKEGPRALVAYRKKMQFIKDDHAVIMFDATPNEIVLRKFFPDLQVEDFVAPNQNLTVIQVGDRTGQVGEFIAKNTKPKEVERAKRNRARLADWAHAQPGKGVLIVKKEVEGLLDEQQDMKIPMAHYHALEGRDVWDFGDDVVKGADLDWCAIVQRSCPLAFVPEKAAMAYFCDDEEPIKRQPWNNGMPWYNVHNVELADGVGGVRYVHPDERVDSCLQGILNASQVQAIGRMRGTRRDGRGIVYIMHNIALDVEVTTVVRSAMLNAMVGGVALYGAQEIERVFGYSGRWIEKVAKPEANIRYWTKDGQRRPCRAWAVAGGDVGAVMDSIGAVRWEAV